MVQIRLKRSDIARAFGMPKYATDGSAAFDLVAAEEVTLAKGKIHIVATGMHMEIPMGYEGQIRPRSGLASQGVTVVNSPGTIDSDYRGEIKIIMQSTKVDTFYITPGMRIAQMVIAPVMQVEFVDVDDLDVTNRGESGFGSTGLQ